MKKFLKSCLYNLQSHRLFQFLNRNRTIILMYHGFTDRKNRNGIENYQGKHINIELFRSQIRYITKNYNVISLDQYIDCCITGKFLPEKSVIITIDDGYKSNYTIAFPIFKEFDIPATIFLTTDFVDNKNFLWVDRLEYAINYTEAKDLQIIIGKEELYFPLATKQDKVSCDIGLRGRLKSMRLKIIEQVINETEDKLNARLSETSNIPEIYEPLNWNEVLEMIKTSKVNFGSHTHNHLILARYDQEVIRNELSLSKKIIERETGVNTKLFCYPNGARGDFNAKSKLLIKELGYSCALTTVSGMNNEFSDLYELKRFSVGKLDLESFAMTTSGFNHFIAQMGKN
jgi:peptidoglycan/xylan/chitin deacetylase (PgdA/CDA1 family)